MKRLDFFMGAAALAAALIAATPSASAQVESNRDEFGNIVRGPYETNSFGDNWYVGVGGGINYILNDNFDGKIAPSIDANVGKWFTPAIGMRIGYQGIGIQMWSDTPGLLGSTLNNDRNQYLQKLGYMYFHGDFMWNISNTIGGYNDNRFWNFVPYVHTGYFRTYGEGGVDFADNEIAAGVGLLHNLRLSYRLDLIIDMRATAVKGMAINSNGLTILPSVTAGLAVDLGWPEFVRTGTIIGALEIANAEKTQILETAIIALEAANAALEVENAGLQKKNNNLTKQMDNLKNQPKFDPAAFLEGMSHAAVYFDIGKATLSEKELHHLDFLAKNLIATADKDTKIYVTIMGSADSNTGTVRRNQHLSEARGKYVFDLLTTKYGISGDRLIVKSEVVKADANPALSRAVLITF
jgi:outer membrane protein OmpA-like peptidoglycan-associated protein